MFDRYIPYLISRRNEKYNNRLFHIHLGSNCKWQRTFRFGKSNLNTMYWIAGFKLDKYCILF